MGYLEDGNAGTITAEFDPAKPGILLIGDSIRMGYCKTVQAQLQDVANVFFPQENCRNTQYVITRLRAWSREVPAEHIGLIQFNCGHWDTGHFNGYETCLTSPEEYRRNIRMIIWQLRQLFPNAKLVFATTTAMNPSGFVGVNPRTNAEIQQYNAIAVETATALGAAINDLWSITITYPQEKFKDYCHLTEPAFEELGTAVADYLRRAIRELT